MNVSWDLVSKIFLSALLITNSCVIEAKGGNCCFIDVYEKPVANLG